MTREEVIENLKGLLESNYVDSFDDAENEALDMAIQVMELDYKTAFQIACALLNGDILYGTDAESVFSEIMKKDGCVCSFDYENYILTHLNELRDNKALSQEPCDDCIFEEGSKYCIEHCPHEAKANKPCDDAISRNMVLSEVKSGMIRTIDGENWKRVNDNVRDIQALPSVTQKSGKWIVHEKPHGIRYLECSHCNTWYLNEHLIRNSYCPNCGCRMESEE